MLPNMTGLMSTVQPTPIAAGENVSNPEPHHSYRPVLTPASDAVAVPLRTHF